MMEGCIENRKRMVVRAQAHPPDKEEGWTSDQVSSYFSGLFDAGKEVLSVAGSIASIFAKK